MTKKLLYLNKYYINYLIKLKKNIYLFKSYILESIILNALLKYKNKNILTILININKKYFFIIKKIEHLIDKINKMLSIDYILYYNKKKSFLNAYISKDISYISSILNKLYHSISEYKDNSDIIFHLISNQYIILNLLELEYYINNEINEMYIFLRIYFKNLLISNVDIKYKKVYNKLNLKHFLDKKINYNLIIIRSLYNGGYSTFSMFIYKYFIKQSNFAMYSIILLMFYFKFIDDIHREDSEFWYTGIEYKREIAQYHISLKRKDYLQMVTVEHYFENE